MCFCIDQESSVIGWLWFIIETPILSWRRPLSYRNQSTDLQSKSVDWFLYDNGVGHERVNQLVNINNGIAQIVRVS